MSKYSVQRTDALKQRLSDRNRDKAYVAQMQRMTNNMGNRLLYLEPGVDMRKHGEHPANVTDVRDPNPSPTYIKWLQGEISVTLTFFRLFNVYNCHRDENKDKIKLAKNRK